MSFFTDLKEKAQGYMAHGHQKNSPMAMVSFLFSENGGLDGLVAKFIENGHGDKIKSWISMGPNESITPEQIKHVLGNEQLQKMGSRIGLDVNQISTQLAEHLPKIIDKITPDGELPAGEAMKEKLTEEKSFFH
jgi:uncharacterized protein YidB (DUF937 family)